MQDDELKALVEKASIEVERLSTELDITKADHVALWLEANGYDDSSHLTVAIVSAHERALNGQPAVMAAATGVAKGNALHLAAKLAQHGVRWLLCKKP